MKIEIIENGKYIVENNGTYYLVIKENIYSTLIDNYFIYTDYNNNKQNLIEYDTEDLYYETETPTLEEALSYINKKDLF